MWWRRLWAKLFGLKVVWLVDFDGEILLRLAYKSTSNQLWSYRHRSIKKIVFLHPNGEVSGLSYTKKWMYI
jgi:hypothetical protein